jgi:hypothetical protein
MFSILVPSKNSGPYTFKSVKSLSDLTVILNFLIVAHKI